LFRRVFDARPTAYSRRPSSFLACGWRRDSEYKYRFEFGPQIDPKDIDTVEFQRGSYAADYGDRTYGVFNVAPRTGFERNNEAEWSLVPGIFIRRMISLVWAGTQRNSRTTEA